MRFSTIGSVILKTRNAVGSVFFGLVQTQDPWLQVLSFSGDREFAYDQANMSSLKQAIVEAEAQGWIVVDMQRDWQRVFAFESLKG